MTWYWYVEREDEILLDIDSPRKLGICVQRIAVCEFARAYSIHTSSSGRGFHVRVVLDLLDGQSQYSAVKTALRFRFLDDPYRAANSTIRAIVRHQSPLLISREIWSDKEPSYTCDCVVKHIGDSRHCPVANFLRGDDWDKRYLGGREPPDVLDLRHDTLVIL